MLNGSCHENEPKTGEQKVRKGLKGRFNGQHFILVKLKWNGPPGNVTSKCSGLENVSGRLELAKWQLWCFIRGRMTLHTFHPYLLFSLNDI